MMAYTSRTGLHNLESGKFQQHGLHAHIAEVNYDFGIGASLVKCGDNTSAKLWMQDCHALVQLVGIVLDELSVCSRCWR